MTRATCPVSWIVSAALALACNSTGVGNPKIDSIELAVRMDDQAEPSGPGAGGAPALEEEDLPAASIRHAILVFGALRWLPCDKSLPASQVTGPFVVDVISGDSEPSLPAVQAPPGGFCGLEAPLSAARSPALLAGRSIWFDGDRADGTRFLLYADMQATLRVQARGAVVWDSAGTPRLLWAFRPRRWLAPSELEPLESVPWDGARAIVINVERHPALYEIIRLRLAGRSTLYVDLNENGVLDADERGLGGLVGDGSTQVD